MFKYLFFIAGLAFALTTTAQDQQPVKWAYSLKKISATKYELHAVATIDKGWHIYAQQQPADAIAIPTQLKVKLNPLVKVDGVPKEQGKKEFFRDESIGISAYQYGERVEFIQTLTLKAAVTTNIAGSVTFQACTNKKCLPQQTEAFALKIQ